MSEATGVALVQIPYTCTPAPPKRYMIAMASEEAQLHYFFTAEQVEKFAREALKLICDV